MKSKFLILFIASICINSIYSSNFKKNDTREVSYTVRSIDPTKHRTTYYRLFMKKDGTLQGETEVVGTDPRGELYEDKYDIITDKYIRTVLHMDFEAKFGSPHK